VVVDGKADESDGKTESGRRVISLDPITVAYLRRHLATLAAEREAFGDDYHDSGVDPKIVADRTGHANMAYTLTIYTHQSTGKDRNAAETVAGVLLGPGWECQRCRSAYIGDPPSDSLCGNCRV
jgi:integrase